MRSAIPPAVIVDEYESEPQIAARSTMCLERRTSLGYSAYQLPQTNQLRALHTIVRDKYAAPEDFVAGSRRIIRLLLEAAHDLLPFDEHRVTTPVGATYRGVVNSSKMCGVSVVRAGESMETELRELAPEIPIGKILIQRDRETKQPHLYYNSLPEDVSERYVLLLEPMLATGGSVLLAIKVLLEADVREDRIVVVNCLASPQAIDAVGRAYPAVRIVTSSLEHGLNQDAYMLPGIGDFGDRYFGAVAR